MRRGGLAGASPRWSASARSRLPRAPTGRVRVVLRGLRGLSVGGGTLVLRSIGSESDTGPRPQDLPGRLGDEGHVVSGEPSLDVAVGREELEGVLVDLARGEAGEPHVELGLRELLTGPGKHS